MTDFSNKLTKTYPVHEDSVKDLAYALTEWLDAEKHLITQNSRTKNGYTIQCRGDASAEWTRYIGMDAAVQISLEQNADTLNASVSFEKLAEKLGIAAAGALFFHPLVFTTGIGAVRQAALSAEIFSFIEKYLGVKPVAETEEPVRTAPEEPVMEEKNVCPYCGTENRIGAIFCKACGSSLVKEPEYCPHCNAELDGDEVFCPFCGEKLK